MNGTPFALATFAANPGAPFAAIVLGDTALALGGVYSAYRDSPRGKAGDTECPHAQEIPATEPLTVLMIRLHYSFFTFCLDLLIHDSLLNFIV